jgi:hypothetical protein
MAAITVTSKKSISFPKFDWGITAGDTRELPEDKDAQKAILAHPSISKSKKEDLTD